MERIATVILAAGEASRMGQPKQLLKIGEQNLVQRMVHTVLAAQCQRAFVVTGAYADEVRSTVGTTLAHCVHNTSWKEGMGSSIRTGVHAAVSSYPDTEAIIILLCDQPLITPQLLRKLAITYLITRQSMVVSAYDGIQGVPALFRAHLFPELLQLSGSTGARAFIRSHTGGAIAVPFSEGRYDVDTPEDYEAIKQIMGLSS